MERSGRPAVLLEGSTEEKGVDDAYMTTWQAGVVLATMTAIWRRLESLIQAWEDLQRLLAEM